jgi:hypothetical protein
LPTSNIWALLQGLGYSALQQVLMALAAFCKKSVDNIWLPLKSDKSECESVADGVGCHVCRRQGQLGKVD